jgi:hypothetical protein
MFQIYLLKCSIIRILSRLDSIFKGEFHLFFDSNSILFIAAISLIHFVSNLILIFQLISLIPTDLEDLNRR